MVDVVEASLEEDMELAEDESMRRLASQQEQVVTTCCVSQWGTPGVYTCDVVCGTLGNSLGLCVTVHLRPLKWRFEQIAYLIYTPEVRPNDHVTLIL